MFSVCIGLSKFKIFNNLLSYKSLYFCNLNMYTNYTIPVRTTVFLKKNPRVRNM